MAVIKVWILLFTVVADVEITAQSSVGEAGEAGLDQPESRQSFHSWEFSNLG